MNDSFFAVDLFSGPGGLAEGFVQSGKKSSHYDFQIVLSVEKDVAAHRTLQLRSFLRKFGQSYPDEYYAYLNGAVSQEPCWETLYPQKWEEACDETLHLELGTNAAQSLMKRRIKNIRKRYKDRTVLLGGPPCQAYSVIGRARNAGNPNYNINEDSRWLLYDEYARVLEWLQPPVAVMENVKGILSARCNGKSVFIDVMESLRNAGGEDKYQLFALSTSSSNKSWADGLEPKDFLVCAENYGIPQRRHRVFIICIRSDVASKLPENLFPKLEAKEMQVTVNDVIRSMPEIRSRLSRDDDEKSWRVTVKDGYELVKSHLPPMSSRDKNKFLKTLNLTLNYATRKSLQFCDGVNSSIVDLSEHCPQDLRDWICDANLTRLPNNETRGHIREDITRFMYATAFATTFARSPKATDFPSVLAPNHANWYSGKFADRFRVQLGDQPATTITSHISKDGHYYIHPDPRQCRSLTVREAARLQTFPDNYLFQGGRTQQYIQVGNAVPPYLAWQIAKQIAKILVDRNRIPKSFVNKSRRTPNQVQEQRDQIVNASVG